MKGREERPEHSILSAINPGGYARNRVSRDLVKHLKQDLRMRWR